MAPLNASNSSDGANHAHLGDDMGQVHSSSNEGELNYYILVPSTASTTVTDGSSSMWLYIWDNQSTISRTVDGTAWTLYRRLDDSYTTGADVYFESNKPIYVWYGYGKNNQGLMSSNLPFTNVDDAPTVANAVADFTVLEDAANTTIDYSNNLTF